MKRGLAGVVLGLALGCQRGTATDDCLLVDAPAKPVGVDVTFAISARLGCPDLARGEISWRQLSGPALRELAPSNAGYRLTARTAALTDIAPQPLPWGVIPLSPATRGEVTLEATWSDGVRRARRAVQIAAAARSRGLTNLAVGARVFLGGRGWRFADRPLDSAAVIDGHPDFASFEPDVSGDYDLRDGRGQPLLVRAGRYGETPLDCGRSGCHPAVTDAAAASPMTTVLSRGLTRAAGAIHPAFGPGYPGCALACHATGEPGADDGGFTHVAATLGLTNLARPWNELPRPLRRLGGVGCLACHGPAALPPPSSRAAILRADVCATCHDAPPRYGHTAAWRSSAMARADRDPRARTDAGCARCHTTAGFLRARQAGANTTADATPTGIACAACHAVHAHGGDTPQPPALLRAPAAPAVLEGVAVPERSLVCVGCHSPSAGEATPTASAAALLFGRGGLDPASGHPLTGASPHARVDNACVGCHRAGPPGLDHGSGHGFRASPAGCKACHAQPLPPSDLAARARNLWTAWTTRTAGARDDGPVHTSGVRLDLRSPLGRAAWNVLLVLEDPGAAAHNAPYARALLAAAERTLGEPARGGGVKDAARVGGTP